MVCGSRKKPRWYATNQDLKFPLKTFLKHSPAQDHLHHIDCLAAVYRMLVLVSSGPTLLEDSPEGTLLVQNGPKLQTLRYGDFAVHLGASPCRIESIIQSNQLMIYLPLRDQILFRLSVNGEIMHEGLPRLESR